MDRADAVLEIHGFTGDREIYDASVGAAGSGFELLDAAAKGLHPDALDWATAVGDRLLAVADRTDGGLNWALMSDIPFPWTPSNFRQSQTGYMQGAAGIGSFFVHLATTLDGQPVKIAFPDTPYATTG